MNSSVKDPRSVAVPWEMGRIPIGGRPWARTHACARLLCGILVALLAMSPVIAEDAAPIDDIEVVDASDAAEDELDSEAHEPPPLPPRVTEPAWISGSFEAGVDATSAGGNSDFDLFQHLRLRVDPPAIERLRFDGWLWLSQDLGGRQPRSSILRDINESWDSTLRVRVPHLYAEIDDVWGDSVLRIGRQRIREGIAFSRIDGVYFKQTHENWDWYAFMGARASLYDDRMFKDLIYGGGVSRQVLPTTRVALDTYYAQQRRRDSDEVRPGIIPTLFGRPYPRRVRTRLGDNLYTVSVWQDLGQTHRLFGRFTLNNGKADELILDLTGMNLAWDISYQVAYRTRLQRLGEQVNDLAYFYRVLGPYEKFDNFLVSAQKPITERLALALEAEVHRTRGGNNRSYTANRDYERFAAILSMVEVRPGLDASIGLERWNASGGEGLWAVTGEVKKKWEKVETTVGLDYQRYKDVLVQYTPIPFEIYQGLVYFVPGIYPGYAPGVRLLDEWSVTTRENVYGAYVRTIWRISDSHEVRGRITYEEDDGPKSPYWRVQCEYTIRF